MLSEDQIYVLVKTPAIRRVDWSTSDSCTNIMTARERCRYRRALYGGTAACQESVCCIHALTHDDKHIAWIRVEGGIQTRLYGGVCNEHPRSTLCTYAHHNIDTLGHVTQWITQYNLFSPSPELSACLEGIGAIGPCCENLHTALSYEEGFLKLGTSLSVDSRCRPGILPML